MSQDAREYSIRVERPGDYPQIRELTIAAFSASPYGHHGEAELIERLRADCPEILSLVAECAGMIVGQALFSPVQIEGAELTGVGMGLGPIAVLPQFQRQRIGSRLIEKGLTLLGERNAPFVCVLGDPHYYGRFGFEPALRFGVYCEFGGAEDGAFQMLWLKARPTVLQRSLAKYRPEFSE